MKTLVTVLMIGLLATPSKARYSGGSGTPGDPHDIATTAELPSGGALHRCYRG